MNINKKMFHIVDLKTVSFHYAHLFTSVVLNRGPGEPLLCGASSVHRCVSTQQALKEAYTTSEISKNKLERVYRYRVYKK